MSDPAWQTTFPFLVAPMQDEWLTGLLLRCDEANHWGSGMTLAHLFRMDEKPTQQHLSLIVAAGVKLDYLAAALAVPLRSIRATTYQAELARLYAVADPQVALLSPTSFSFRLCPTCVAEERRLSRILVLPHITACPHHRVTLVSTCLCGTALRPSIGKLLHLPARSVVWIGQSCPARRQMQSGLKWKKNCCRITNFSGPMEPPKSLRVRFG